MLTSLLTLLLTLLVLGLIFYLIYWVILQIPLPAPFGVVARAVLGIIAVICLIYLLVSFGTHLAPAPLH